MFTKLLAQKRFLAAWILLALVGIFLITTQVEASFLGLSWIFGDPVGAREKAVPVGNSQTIGLQPRVAVAAVAVATKATDEVDLLTTDGALLPDAGPLGTVVDIVEPTTDQISLYTVRAGDTLSEIAEMYGVSINTIAWANDFSARSPLHEGQVLVILPVSGVRYTVAKGDTIASVAKKFKGDADEISRFNDLEGTKLAVGQTLIIPNGEVAPVTSGSGTRSSQPVRASGPEYAGYYLRPVASGVKTQGLHGYNAVDFGVSPGTRVLAAADGRVIVSKEGGWNGGYGNYVVIEHNNKSQTLYAHLSQSLVATGQSVTQGQAIGYSGSTGKSTGPHLHFEIRGAKNPF